METGDRRRSATLASTSPRTSVATLGPATWAVACALAAACSAGADDVAPAAIADGGSASSTSSSSGASSTSGSSTSSSASSSGADDGGSEGGADGGELEAGADSGPPPPRCGTHEPPCALGEACTADADCSTKVCSAGRKCVAAPSCRGSNGPAGVETCGTGEPGAPGALVESCCTSLPLPTTKTRRLDRYEITSGRLRAFISALAAANGGDPNVRAFAKAHAAANPTSQLGKLATAFPGLLDVLPDRKAVDALVALPIHLGAFPLDPINQLDGCFITSDGYGHATYWQPPEDLKPLGIGYPAAKPDGVRKYSREILDAKPVNCVMPLVLATFCAWDGGELARTSDYWEVWARKNVSVGTATVSIPWSTLLPVGDFNWRNGHGDACPTPGWPNCINPQPTHYRFPPTGATPADDDSSAIGAPGRFPLDVTSVTSANGQGWFDVGGNLMEAAWPVGSVNVGANPVKNVCDASATTGGTACTRPATGRSGILRYTGDLPHVALVGYSFEGHQRRSEAYLAAVPANESKIPAGDLKPVTFQYGKVGGRCARPGP